MIIFLKKARSNLLLNVRVWQYPQNGRKYHFAEKNAQKSNPTGYLVIGPLSQPVKICDGMGIEKMKNKL